MGSAYSLTLNLILTTIYSYLKFLLYGDVICKYQENFIKQKRYYRGAHFYSALTEALRNVWFLRRWAELKILNGKEPTDYSH